MRKKGILKTYTEIMIPAKDILRDSTYQRPISEKRVANIVKNFDRRLLNPPKVSDRDGNYYVFDGQHTVAALMAICGEDVAIKCRVYDGLTKEDEAQLFILQNGESAKVDAVDRMRAKYNIGDPDTVKIVDGAQSQGVNVSFNRRRDIGCCTACSTLEKIYSKLSYPDYLKTLRILRNAWDGDPYGFSRQHLSGMGYFISVYGDKFDEKRMVKSLSLVAPASIIRDANTTSIPNKVAVARCYLNIYNKKTRVNRLRDKL